MRPHLLLTNDDGIDAPGLTALWEALKAANIGDLSIVAPSTQRSGTSVSITWDRPMHIEQVPWEEGQEAWAVDGTPADCVKLGMRLLLKSEPTLVISGINAGSNAGRNVLHSGTAGAVMEALLRDTPGIAFSCEDEKNPNFDVAQRYIPDLVRYILKHPLREGSFLNVNIPKAASDRVKGFRLTHQGKGRWREEPRLHQEYEKGASYWLGGKPEELIEDSNCDVAWLRKGYLTAVPVHVHNLTDRKELAERESDFENYFLNTSKDIVGNSTEG